MSDQSETNPDGRSSWVQFNEGEINESQRHASESPEPEQQQTATEDESLPKSPSSPVDKQKTTNWVKFEENNENASSQNNNKSKPASPIEAKAINSNNVTPDASQPAVLETNYVVSNHPLANDANRIKPVDSETVAVDMSVTCTQHSVPETRTMPDYANSRNQQNPPITQGFSNGDCIVSVLPLNNKCAWFTKAQFKPELVPEELMAQGLTLTVEDYVQALKILVSDFRFNMFIICYKRILIAWILIGFIFLISFLFSGLKGIVLFICGIVWLILNAFGIFFCMWFKIKLSRGLEYCMAEVNSYLYKQKIVLALDDRGKLSCHKVNLIFLYFDLTDCLKYLNDMLNNEDANKRGNNRTSNKEVDLSRMDIDESGIVIVGSTNTVLSQQSKRAEKLLLRYLQRWAKEFVRRRIDLHIDLYNEGPDYQAIPARHCETARCPCQYIEEYLSFKPNGKCSWSKIFGI